MVKPMYALSIALCLFAVLYLPMIGDTSVPTNHSTNQVGSLYHTTVTDDIVAKPLSMPLMINCDLSQDTFYLDASGNVTILAQQIANPTGGAPPYTYNSISSFACNDIITNPNNVEVIVTDDVGDMDNCFIDIYIIDSLPPTLSCPSDTVNVSYPDSCGLTMQLDTVTAIDNCGIDTLYNNWSDMKRIYDFFPVDSTLITYYAEDINGNIDSCSFYVTVMDMTAPVMECPVTPTSPYSCYAGVPKSFSNLNDFLANGGMVADSCGVVDTSFVLVSEVIDSSSCPQEITRTYQISDNNGNTASCDHVLYVIDENKLLTIPTLADITMNNDPDMCSATFTPTVPKANKNCGVTVTRVDGGDNTFEVGLDSVMWRFTDGCGSDDTVTQYIRVFDNQSPSVTCTGGKSISLTNSPANFLSATSFVKSVEDNCKFTSVGVSRMGGGCDPANDTSPDDEVNFCCDDLLVDSVMVIVTVTDQAKNTSQCMVAVCVKDNNAPVVEQGLPDITVSCDYFIDLDDLSDFGDIQFDENDVEEIDIDDPLFDIVGAEDGLVIDNCNGSLTLDDDVNDQRINNQGKVIRTFTITDSDGNTVQDVQEITIRDTDTLKLSDIIFPNDTSIVGDCNTSLDTSVAGVPIIDNDDICTMPAYEFDDLVFDNPNKGCKFIKRTWTVIDMAQFVANTNQGRWSHVQYISLVDTVAPVIQGCRDTTLCAPLSQCEGNGSLFITATDACTDSEDLYYKYLVDINNDGTVDYEGTNDSLKVYFPEGIHKVTWKVEDRCGNLTKCEMQVTMRECKSPTPICLNGLSIDLNEEREAEIWASDFNHGSFDNCTSNSDLIYSFSKDSDDRVRVLTCTDKGDLPLKMYVTDASGNQSFCNTFIAVSDNDFPCTNRDTIVSGSISTLRGSIATDENTPIKGVEITLNIDSNHKNTNTTQQGSYEFTDLPHGSNLKLEARKSADCLNGVSTLDLVIIQRHILGIKELSSPYRLIAADVNMNERISTSDLVELRKLILGVNEEFESNDCWTFVDKTYQFDDPSFPFDFPKQKTITDFDASKNNADIVAIKIGDVNGSVSNIIGESTDNRSAQKVGLTIQDRVFAEGALIKVPLYLDRDIDALAMQMNLTYDPTVLQFQSIAADDLNINEEMLYTADGMVNLAYSNIDGVPLKEGQAIFEVTFLAKSSAKLSDVLTENSSMLQGIIYDELETENYIHLNFDEDNVPVLQIIGHGPNPFADFTNIEFVVGEDMDLEFTIIDGAGRKLFTDQNHYKAGNHIVKLDGYIFGEQKGVFYLHILGAETQEMKKLIRIN